MARKSKSEGQAYKAFLARVARMYYTLEMSQQEIAEQLKVGRSSVGRFLKEARDHGVVQIHIGTNLAQVRRTDLEEHLIMNFGLKEVVVYRGSASEQESGFYGQVGRYMDSLLPVKGKVGLTGGRVNQKISMHLRECESRPFLEVVQLSGNSGKTPSTAVIQSWSQNLDAVPVYIHAPSLVQDLEARSVLMAMPGVEESLSAVAALDLIVVGIGLPKADAAIIENGLLSGLTGEDLAAKSVGDVSYHFFDEQGRFSMPEISDYVIGASTENLMQVPTRVAVVFGEEKVEAIKGAAAGKIINVLITDEETAERVIKS